ncbi:hypothetical protein [Paraglaciecola sp. L3A3]|uniref:hypothetical protein n=1 Tax=Paraglaciecola sp. L3A3 TaxID=2686358 RepID=UPI001E2D248F|nr:hypothetical protein [Paraglaciecola sp. L3A3]
MTLACSKEVPSDPACRVDEQQSLAPAEAVCLIKLNGKLIAVKNNNMEKWDLPKDKQQGNLSAQCTAHQAAWKATGLNVEIGQLLWVDEGNTHYFTCLASSQFSSTQQDFPVPPWANHKIEKIGLLDPFATRDEDWEPRLDVIKLREAFTQIESY